MVALTHDIESHGLQRGDIGVVVHGEGDGQAVEVEFTFAQGETVAVLTLESAEVRLLGEREILHVRALEPATA